MNLINQLFGLSSAKPQARTLQDVVLDITNGNKTQAGIFVGTNESLSYAPVWQAVNMISGDVAKLKLNVYVRQPEVSPTARQQATSHNAYRYCKQYANERQSAFRFWSRFVWHKLFWNNAYAWIKRAPQNGRVLGLYNLRPDRTAFDPKDGLYYSEIGLGADAEIHAFKPSDVLHCEGLAIAGVIEPSLLKNARESWSVGLAAQQHASKFFAGDCNAGGILEVPANFTKRAKDNLEQGFSKRYEGQAFQTIVLRDGAKFHQLQIDAEKSQMNETRVAQAREVANWFNLPPSKLGIPDSGGYGSRAEDNRSYHDQTLSPILCEIAGECGIKLLTKTEKEKSTHYFEHDTTNILSLDRKAQAEIAKIEFEMGALSPNEYRAATNRNPREDGRGDMYVEPNANHVVSDGDSMEEDAEQPDGLEVATRLLTDGIRNWKRSLSQVIESNWKRKTSGKFARWFADFEPNDYPYIAEVQQVGLRVETGMDICNDLRSKLDETKPDDWEQVILNFCEGMNNV